MECESIPADRLGDPALRGWIALFTANAINLLMRCNMKKIKNLSESSFLKLVFAFLTAAFLIAAVCMPDRSSMFSGLWQIISQTS